VISWWADCQPDERSFQGVLTVAAEQQPCGVQVVEWVGLVASSFQFFTRLAAVFSDNVIECAALKSGLKATLC
jgi:hypothetical protein